MKDRAPQQTGFWLVNTTHGSAVRERQCCSTEYCSIQARAAIRAWRGKPDSQRRVEAVTTPRPPRCGRLTTCTLSLKYELDQKLAVTPSRGLRAHFFHQHEMQEQDGEEEGGGEGEREAREKDSVCCCVRQLSVVDMEDMMAVLLMHSAMWFRIRNEHARGKIEY